MRDEEVEGDGRDEGEKYFFLFPVPCSLQNINDKCLIIDIKIL